MLAQRGATRGDSVEKDLEATVAKIDIRRKEAASTRKSLAAVQKALDASRAVGQHPDWSVLLGLLAEGAGGELVLSGCNLMAKPAREGADTAGSGGYTLHLTGIGPSLNTVFTYATTLESYRTFESVHIASTRTEVVPGLEGAGHPLVIFEFTCTLSDAGVQKEERR
jgi:hypothetical protein